MGNSVSQLAGGQLGQASSCSSKGALLLVASANGDVQVAQEVRPNSVLQGVFPSYTRTLYDREVLAVKPPPFFRFLRPTPRPLCITTLRTAAHP